MHFRSERCFSFKRELLKVSRADIPYSCISARTSFGSFSPKRHVRRPRYNLPELHRSNRFHTSHKTSPKCSWIFFIPSSFASYLPACNPKLSFLLFSLRHRDFIFHVSIPHLHPILLIQLSQYLRRNTCHDAVIRNITVYDCPCRYNTVFSDGHPTTDRRARTDPTSASDVDRLCILKVMETIRILLRQALIREERMESFFPADAAFFFSSTAVCG